MFLYLWEIMKSEDDIHTEKITCYKLNNGNLPGSEQLQIMIKTAKAVECVG